MRRAIWALATLHGVALAVAPVGRATAQPAAATPEPRLADLRQSSAGAPACDATARMAVRDDHRDGPCGRPSAEDRRTARRRRRHPRRRLRCGGGVAAARAPAAGRT